MSKGADLCPTCGSTVYVVSADEGTSHYEPADGRVPRRNHEIGEPMSLSEERRARLVFQPTPRPNPGPERLTHGRHCPCTACCRQDWSEPNLASCGMHGSGCPPVYDPFQREES